MSSNHLPDTVSGLTEQPHMRVVIRPARHEEHVIPSLSECLRIIRHTSVRLRGWDFPQIGRDQDMVRGNNYIGCATNFFGLEYWRFYQSGQFIHLSTLEECRKESRKILEESARQHLGKFSEFRDRDWSKTPGFISIINFLYTISEIYEFAARLCQAGVYREECIIEIGLRHIRGFILMTETSRWWSKYCEAAQDTLEHAWTIPSDVLISDSAEKALEAVEWFFERFGWDDPNIEGLRTDQHKFLRLTSSSA